jgi:hypothetical protein
MYDKAMTGIKLYLVKTSLTQEFVITSELIPQQARGRMFVSSFSSFSSAFLSAYP